MDLIRIFIDTAFSKIADRFFAVSDCEESSDTQIKENGMIIDEPLFVDECRCHHPELSDDQIRMIFGLFRDEWSFPPEDLSNNQTKGLPDIFNVIFRFSQEVLRIKNKEPFIIFRHLLRWRELTLDIGEDTLVAAYLAYLNRNLPLSNTIVNENIERKLHLDGIDFCGWPTVLHNDNPHLNYIFKNNRMCDLHSHLYASTDNFTISWVSLMNKIDRRKKNFIRLGNVHDEKRAEHIANSIYSYVILACSIRINLWRLVEGRELCPIINLQQIQSSSEFYATRLQTEIIKEKAACDPLDYIPADISSPMRVIAGERKFLYAVYRYILGHDDTYAAKMFYQYLLAKNKFRSFMVQVDSNRGFSNFKRYQDLKLTFMMPEYRALVGNLAVWEAIKMNHTDIFETRIAPIDGLKSIKSFRNSCTKIDSEQYKEFGTEWSLLVHFLKHPENYKEFETPGPTEFLRDKALREKIHRQSIVLRQIVKMSEWEKAENSYLSRIKGIDAASSEIGCRPEIFAQAFRFLKASGYYATFHVGEDFYDIADGLRAIDEAITFLGLEAGDRLGHALALGIDPDDFYDERHNYIALPAQWMLDNVVWLYFSSRKYNTPIEPSTEDFLLRTFRDLVRRIGYETIDGDGLIGKIEIIDYYQSMLLRGDAPKTLDDKRTDNQWMVNSEWQFYEKQQSEELREIRIWNKQAQTLHYDYMSNGKIMTNGRKIKSFVVPMGYRKLIRHMQDQMMKFVSKMQLGIECCPSSNYKIGYCKRYDRHPIFRFMPVRGYDMQYPLAVTVNTDDLGIFSTSLPNEYSLLALALLKITDSEGNHIYSTQEVYDWIERIIKNGEKFAFKRLSSATLIS